MAKWLIIAALVTIGVTALLISVLYRANRPLLERAKQDQRGDGGDALIPMIAVGGVSSSRDADADLGASDSGGGDGGGGGGGD